MSAEPGPALATLELNDVGLVLAGPAAWAGFEPAPGIAIVADGEVVTGRVAEERARLMPRWVHQSYWSGLGLEPIGRPFPPGLRTADLAFNQLEKLWGEAVARLGGEPVPAGVLLVAPGSLTLEQLGLALAVARRAGLPVTGCVDAAVAAASAAESADGDSWVHLDLERGRAVATELRWEAETGEVVRGRVIREDRVGLASLLDEWARAVAREFVRTTRFDPLHLADSERELYLRLPGWLTRLADEETIPVSIAAGGRVYEIELSRAWMAAAAALAYERLGELARAAAAGKTSSERAFLLSHRLRRLPGFAIPGHALPPGGWLDPEAASFGALAHADRIHRPGEEALPLVVRLPRGR